MKETSKLVALNDKALLSLMHEGSDEAADLLTRRLAGRVTDAMRAVWPKLRAGRVPVSAARRLLLEADRAERAALEAAASAAPAAA